MLEGVTKLTTYVDSFYKGDAIRIIDTQGTGDAEEKYVEYST